MDPARRTCVGSGHACAPFGVEWACCGNAFIAGDEVELQVVAPDAWVREKYGERGASVDAHETHHQVGADDAPTTAVRGRVRGIEAIYLGHTCLLYTSPSPRDATLSRMPSSA